MADEADERASEVVPRGGPEADRGGRAADRRARRPRVGGGPHRRRHPPAAGGAAERIGELDAERPVVLYCRGGNRSTMAAEALADAGFDAVKLSEGIVGWDEAGLALEPEDGYVAESGEAAAILQARKTGLTATELNTLIPVRFCYFPLRGGSSRPGQEAARQGPDRDAGEPGDLRERPRARDPDHRARVRRLRQRSRAVPRRRAGGEPVHRLPPQAGRLRPAPARRPDDPGQAAVRRRHPRADGGLRQRRREVRAARQGPHHDPPEHPDPPRPAARHGAADARDRRGRPLLARGLRQHDPQRHRRPLGRGRRRRGLRPDRPTPAPTSATSSATRRPS